MGQKKRMCSWFSKQLKLKQQGSWQHAVFIIILFRSSQTWCIFSIHCSASAQPKDFKDAFKAALKLCLSRFKKSATSASFEKWHSSKLQKIAKWKHQTLDFWHSQATSISQSNIPHHVPSPPTSSMPKGGNTLCLSPGTPSLVPSQTNAELQEDPLPSQLFASAFAFLNGKTGERLYSGTVSYPASRTLFFPATPPRFAHFLFSLFGV